MSPGAVCALQCAIVSGKIIDRNLAPGKPSLAEALELDKELDAVATRLPYQWWSIPTELPRNTAELDNLREQLLQQFVFFWVRLYIYLPFLVKSTADESQSDSKATCMEAARQVLKRFQLLRAKSDAGISLFECKTTDFACFTASVVLLIGHFHCSSESRSPELSNDLNLFLMVDQIFQGEEKDKGCKLASQCRKTLKLLLSNQEDSTYGSETTDGLQEIVIPYFAVVIRKRVNQQALRQSAVPNTGGDIWDLPSNEFNQMELPSAITGSGWDTDALFLQYIDTSFHHSYTGLGGASFDPEVADTWFGDGWLNN